MQEKMQIINHSKKDPTKTINSCNEIYGACPHETHFHRYIKIPANGTDDALNSRNNNLIAEEVVEELMIFSDPIAEV